MPKIRISDLLPALDTKRTVFVVEYMKDFAAQRAAEAAGFSREYGYTLMKEGDVQKAIEVLISQRLEDNMIDADWLLGEMVDNHLIARQQGNISASNTALSLVAKHKRIDAFAADKIKVSTDADVVDRLEAAKKRVKKESDDKVSFI